jgi:hypothetical protein
MDNMGAEEYNQETFKAAYDQDPQIKSLVASFDPEGVTLKGGEEPQAPAQDNTVDQMAQSATANAMSQ